MPQSARLSAGGGVQLLFGQCPNRGDANFKGASLTRSYCDLFASVKREEEDKVEEIEA